MMNRLSAETAEKCKIIKQQISDINNNMSVEFRLRSKLQHEVMRLQLRDLTADWKLETVA